MDAAIAGRLAQAVGAKRRRDRARRSDELKRRRAEAWTEARRLVERFREIDPQLGRIVLFGSVAEGTATRSDFDIDLSFEGVEYYRCVGAALDSPFPVDLVDYRAAAPHIREAIDRRGVVLYAP